MSVLWCLSLPKSFSILLCKFVLKVYAESSRTTRMCTYNVISRRVRESLLPWTSNKHYIFVCVCMFARARGHAHACMHVALLIQHVTRMRHIVT
jgi:hypothetical protein